MPKAMPNWCSTPSETTSLLHNRFSDLPSCHENRVSTGDLGNCWKSPRSQLLNPSAFGAPLRIDLFLSTP